LSRTFLTHMVKQSMFEALKTLEARSVLVWKKVKFQDLLVQGEFR